LALLRNNLRQVAYTLALLSSSSLSWYRCKNRDRLWKRCGLPYDVTLFLCAQN